MYLFIQKYIKMQFIHTVTWMHSFLDDDDLNVWIKINFDLFKVDEVKNCMVIQLPHHNEDTNLI